MTDRNADESLAPTIIAGPDALVDETEADAAVAKFLDDLGL